ncbi:MAG: PIN domain-containing protein, partial [Candidatus Eremiobacterota bacterium]
AAAPWGRSFYLLDTSVIIDGRIVDICEAGFLEGTLVVPQFVLNELQKVADSEDAQKRNRGRRGLDILHKLRTHPGLHIEKKDYDDAGVDGKLVRLAQDLKLPLVTTDYNLHKVASIQNIRVLNINELASSLKPVVLPGEEILVKVIREGKEAGQGIGFLSDGTMVVVEKGRRYVGERAFVEVTSVVQTATGKMIFARFKSLPGNRATPESEDDAGPDGHDPLNGNGSPRKKESQQESGGG